MLGFWSTAHVNLNAWTPLRLASGYGQVGAAWILVEGEVDADRPSLTRLGTVGTVRKSRGVRQGCEPPRLGESY